MLSIFAQIEYLNELRDVNKSRIFGPVFFLLYVNDFSEKTEGD